jgi:GTP cyclohydrolase I
MNRKKIEKGVKLILEGIGEDPERPGIKNTPSRIAELYKEIFSGLETPTEEILVPIEGESHDELVLLKDISFYSVCEHHLLPFIGKAHIAYILKPRGAMVIIDAEHLCLSMRGIKKPNARTVTSAVRGIFRTKESTRLELLELIKKTD